MRQLIYYDCNFNRSPHEESRNSRNIHSNNRDKRNSGGGVGVGGGQRDSSRSKRHQQQLQHQMQHQQQQQQRRPLSHHDDITENTQEMIQQQQQQHLEPYDVLCLQDRQQETQHRMAPSSTPDVAMESQYLAHRLRQSGGAGGSNR